MAQTDYPSHIHDYYEIEYVKSGSGINIVNGLEEPMLPGYMYMLTPRDIHRIKVCEPMDIINIKLKDEACTSELLSHCTSFMSAMLSDDGCTAAEFLISKIEMLSRELVHDDNQSVLTFHIKSCVSALISCIMLDSSKKHDIPVSYRKTIKAMQLSMKYINEKFTEPITLDSVAKIAGYSSCYFSSLFSKFVGMSFVEYVNRVRLVYAANLLHTTDKSISEIAYTSGFGSQSQFLRTYKSFYGILPGDARKNARR